MRSTIAIATIALLLATSGAARADATSSGKFTAHSTNSSVPIGTTDAAIGSVTIPLGKRKHQLQVEVVISANIFADSLATHVDVNGVALQPSGNVGRTKCNNNYINCTASGTFWADLDELEAAAPGTFIKQPLVITAWGSTLTGSGNAKVTIRSRILRK